MFSSLPLEIRTDILELSAPIDRKSWFKASRYFQDAGAELLTTFAVRTKGMLAENEINYHHPFYTRKLLFISNVSVFFTLIISNVCVLFIHFPCKCTVLKINIQMNITTNDVDTKEFTSEDCRALNMSTDMFNNTMHTLRHSVVEDLWVHINPVSFLTICYISLFF